MNDIKISASKNPVTQVPLVHLVAGSTGAGKTTYARDLASRLGGIRFSIDNWMVALFGPDMPMPMDAGWILDRAARCRGRILAETLQIARRGVPVVLDLGFSDSDQRAKTAVEMRFGGLDVALHWLDVDAPERWRRVCRRNAQRAATGDRIITREMFDFIEARFEPPSESELKILNGRCVSPLD